MGISGVSKLRSFWAMLCFSSLETNLEGKQHHRAAQVPVVVPQRLQSCLSQKFIHCLELVESLDKPFWRY